MRKFNTLLIGILLSTSSLAQILGSHLVPDSVISKVVQELADKDYLQRKTQYQDTIISMYVHRDSLHQASEKLWVEKENSYKADSTASVKQLNVCEDEKKTIKKEGNRKALKTGLGGMGVGALITLILILL